MNKFEMYWERTQIGTIKRKVAKIDGVVVAARYMGEGWSSLKPNLTKLDAAKFVNAVNQVEAALSMSEFNVA